VPKSAFDSAQSSGKLHMGVKERLEPGAEQWQITVGEKMTDRILSFNHDVSEKAASLKGMIRFDFAAADQWFEEDTPIFKHPKDPFKRIDIIASSRPVEISIDGIVVADAASSQHLYETSLPCRFYLPLTAVDVPLLRPSSTKTVCPYKGEAEYYNVVVNGQTYKDIAWFYTNPTLECAPIRGLLCFYNEKVDIELGRQKLERPKTFFG